MTTEVAQFSERRLDEAVDARAIFDELYAEHRAAVLRFLSVDQRDPEQAIDLTALTFERAWRETQRGRTVGLGWLIRTARNAAIDACRRAHLADLFVARSPRIAETEASAEDVVVTGSEAARVRAAVRALPAPQRHAIALRYSTDLTVAEIARVIDKSEAATEKLIARGLNHLREALDDRD